MADEVRAYNPPATGSGDPRPEGIKVPSVRLEKKDGFQPHHIALFLGVDPAQTPYSDRSTLVDRWELEIEFLQKSPRASVNQLSSHIDWRKPRFRLADAGSSVLPAYPARPNAADHDPTIWHDFEVEFA